MTFQIGLVLSLLTGAVAVFALELLPVDLVGLCIIALLVIFGILTPEEAFSGFSNPAVIMIASLLVISGGLYHSGVPEAIGRKIYQYSGRKPGKLVIFIMSAQIAVSAFMNNVASTAMFLPGVTALAKKARISASKLLIPLAYASMLGGTCTIIGTSTNLAVNGLLQSYQIPQFAFFEYAPIGISISIAGVVYIYLTYRFLLPDRGQDASSYTREYISEAVALASSSLIGKSIAQSGLDKLDLMVVGIIREREQIMVPSAQDRIQVNDILLVQGNAANILEIKSMAGLKITEDTKQRNNLVTNIVEVEVAPRSDFIGKTLKEVFFRQRYGLSVIALYRKQETVLQKIGELPLQMGDVLLIQGPQTRLDQLKEDENFIFLNELAHKTFQKRKGVAALVVFGTVVCLGGIGVLPIAALAFLGALGMIVTRILPLKDAYGSMEWPLLMLIAGMMSLGLAMEKTGTAQYLAEWILWFGSSPYFLLAAFFVLTVLLTQSLSNAAAALAVLPIAVHVALEQGVNPQSYAMVVSVAASCSFLTPLEPACALVYNAGKYRFSDFVRAGLGLTVIVFVVCMLVIPVLWPF